MTAHRRLWHNKISGNELNFMQKQMLTMLGGLLSGKSGEQQGTIETRTVAAAGDEFDYQIYVPPQAKDEKNLPLTIFLHGIGQRGAGGVVPTTGAGGALARHYLSQVPPSIILLPQCRAGKYWSDAAMDEMTMNALAQTVEEFQADAKRIYLSGISMGGYGVWHFAMRYPKRFAALVSICGGSSIVKGERFASVAEAVGKTPAWIFHGADDRVVPVSESRELVRALKAVGGNVKYSEYAGVGHNVWMNALGEKDLLAWLFAQRLD